MLERFVPVADEVGRLQRGRDPECKLFQAVAEHGHYRGRTKPSNTRQGMYALTPSGRFLASRNTRSARQILLMLDEALGEWERLSQKARLGESDAVREKDVTRWEHLYPEDGLVLDVFTRDLPREKKTRGWRGVAWNQDAAWFNAKEAAGFVPEARKGAMRALPSALARRIVRLNLRDTVRGQTPPFSKDAVRVAELTSRVETVSDAALGLVLSGRAEVSMKGNWKVVGFSKKSVEQKRGFRGKFLGRATWDRKSKRFRRFELVALGTRWGGTQFNARSDDLEPAPLGVAFVLSKGNRVAPSTIWHYGWPLKR